MVSEVRKKQLQNICIMYQSEFRQENRSQISYEYINLAFNVRYCLYLYEGFKRKNNIKHKNSEVTER